MAPFEGVAPSSEKGDVKRRAVVVDPHGVTVTLSRTDLYMLLITDLPMASQPESVALKQSATRPEKEVVGTKSIVGS